MVPQPSHQQTRTGSVTVQLGPALAAAPPNMVSNCTFTPAESRGCVAALKAELDRLGFNPAVTPADEGDSGRVRVDFLHCPFRELAEAYPDLVCNLHRGIVEGFVDAAGKPGMVEAFNTLADRDPCNTTLRSSTGPEQA